MGLVFRLLLAGTSGVGVWAGFPPHDLTLLLLIGLAGFVASLHAAAPRTGVMLGLAFGLGFMVPLLRWLTVLGSDAWLALSLLCALFYAFGGWALVLVSRFRFPLLWMTALWVGVEYLRSEIPFGGFPWGRLAFATADTPLVSFARWVGVPLTSGLVFLACAAVGSAVAAVVLAPGTDRAPAATGRRLAVGVAVPAAVLTASTLLPVGLADPGRTLTVAAVQGDVPGTGADSLGERNVVTANHADATIEHAARVEAGDEPAPDVMLWPENSTDIDPYSDARIYDQIDDAVATIGVPTLVGVILDGPAPGEARNVALVWEPGAGPTADRYVKRHLVPFGEYVPLRDQIAPFVSRLDQIPRDMVPGDEPGALDLGPVRVGTMLCFDVAYDDTVADNVRSGAELMVVQTNNATYYGSDQPEQQWGIEQVRAVETGRDLAVASVNGISGFVNADGSVAQRTTSRDRQVLSQEMTTATGVTLGVRLGAWIERGLALLALGALVLALIRRRRGRRPAPGDHEATRRVILGQPAGAAR
ncbi:MAG: apolipoprotein N-acyltransferase [Actinomycetota bacterium]|nr:apolipoprotein N-acyltransferase [Actinomycetota bacterium]